MSIERDQINPYAAPDSTFSEPTLDVPGGTLEATLAGQTRWTIGELLSDSWQLVSGFKGTFWLAVLMMIGAQIVINVLTGIVVGVTQEELAGFAISLPATILVMWPLQMGLVMLGVRRAGGAETRASLISEYFPQVGRIAGLLIIQGLLLALGFMLLIIPGLYLAVSWILAPAFLLDRRMGIWESLEASRKVIGTCWFRTFGLMLVFIPLSLGVVLTLGIGAIWFAPFASIAVGMLYHRLAGYAGGADA
jgi:hypothetical protein